MNYNVTIVKKPGSTRLYTSYRINSKTIVKTTGLPDTPSNRAYINKNIIPKYIGALVDGRDPTAVARRLSFYLNKVLEKAVEKSQSTHATYVSASKKLLEFLKDRPMNEINPSDIENMIVKLKVKMSDKTINTYLAPLSLAYIEAKKHREIGVFDNPVSLIDRPEDVHEEKKQPFSLNEVVRMIQAASGEFKKFLIIAFFAGPRHGEVLGLKRGDLDIENNLIMINKQYNISFMTADAKLKTHKYKPENEIKVPSIIWKLLGELSNNPDDFVFDHSTLGNSAREWLKKNWNETLKNAKIEAHSRTPYTTRHTFVSLASSSKVNPLLISDTVGHSGLKMIEEAYGSIDRSNEDFEDFSSMVEQQIQIENQL